MKTPYQFRFTLTMAAMQWGLDRKTLLKRLAVAGKKPGDDNKYSVHQIDVAVHGDKQKQQIRFIRAKIAALHRANRKADGELVDLEEFRRDQEKIAISARQFIYSLAWASDAQKDEILWGLSKLFSAEHPDKASGE